MKRFTVILMALFMAIAFTVPAFAERPRMKGGDMMNQKADCTFKRAGMAKLTDEQKEKLEKVHKKFIDDTTSTRNDLRTKRTELENLFSSPDPDVSKAKAIQKEISELQAKIDQRRIELRAEQLKINPDARYGRHMMGGGMGPGTGGPGMKACMGHGGHMGGQGPAESFNK